MKFLPIGRHILLVLMSLLVVACAKSKMSESTQTQDITFKKGKLIEVAYLSMKKRKEKSLKEDYLPKAMAIAKEYDGKMLGRFKVIKKAGGKINPQMIGIFEWPDIATKERMMSDPRYKEIKPIRDAALSFVKLGYYEVSKDTTITFKEDKVYEFFGAWVDSKDKLDEYFKVSGPIKKNYGRPEPIFKTMLGVMIDAPKGSQTYRPQMVGIVEWDQSDDFFILIKNKDFKKKAKPLFEAAVARIDMLHTKIMIIPPAMPTMPKAPEISADFPFKSHFVDILGSEMHYIDEGEGDPILFIHGNPTSSYLWRNVLPHLRPQGRVIAIDLIGMGKSDKPKIDYTFADHIRYVEGFIETLKLKNIILVLHDWGSALGLDYASRHENNVKGIAFMEAIIPPSMPFPSYEAMGPLGEFFRTMRDPEKGPELIINQNMFIEEVLPSSVMRKLGEAEMDAYRAPFLDPQSRKPILVWPNEVPIGGVPTNTVRVVSAYGKWMVNTDLPMLHLYASPGVLNPPQVAEWLVQNVNNIESIYIGPGIHFVQEDHPHVIGRAIGDWRRRLLT